MQKQIRNIRIFVNLKRFEVSQSRGGICPIEDPKDWVRLVIRDSVELGLGALNRGSIVFLLQEALLLHAIEELSRHPKARSGSIEIGCQSVYREDIKAGANFGAFTSNMPATAAAHLGCTWTIIGHSEERRDKLGVIEKYDRKTINGADAYARAKHAVNALVNEEVIAALSAGLNVLLCIGETIKDKGEGMFEDQRPRIERTLRDQLSSGLAQTVEFLQEREIVIGYEPIWAIGPGKTPPDGEYITFASSYIKKELMTLIGRELPVVYGGGLKEENALMIAAVDAVDGGLVALTSFSGQIAFRPAELKTIVDKYINTKG